MFDGRHQAAVVRTNNVIAAALAFVAGAAFVHRQRITAGHSASSAESGTERID
jgi:hypothetical protein